MNGVGVAGMCWRCRIMPVKVAGSHGTLTWSNAIAGILWATDHGANVINMSFGSLYGSAALADAVSYAESHGVVVVAAAGNEGNTAKFYPAAYPGILSVAATTSNDSLYSFSTRGSWVRLAAPGCTWTSQRDSTWGSFCGTSAAAPVVAGIAGLYIAAHPGAMRSEVQYAITSTAAPIAVNIGGGRVDAAATLSVSSSADPSSSPSAPGPPSAAKASGGDATAKVSWHAPAADGGSTITGYTVTSTPGNKTCSTGGALGCTVKGLTNGTTYTFTVRASNKLGTGLPSDPSNTVKPRAPDTTAPTASAAQVRIPCQLNRRRQDQRARPMASADRSVGHRPLLAGDEREQRTMGVSRAPVAQLDLRRSDAQGRQSLPFPGTRHRRCRKCRHLRRHDQFEAGRIPGDRTCCLLRRRLETSELERRIGRLCQQVEQLGSHSQLRVHGQRSRFRVDSCRRPRDRGHLARRQEGSNSRSVFEDRKAGLRGLVIGRPENTSHTVSVRVTGTKNASSTSDRVDVDAFIGWQ